MEEQKIKKNKEMEFCVLVQRDKKVMIKEIMVGGDDQEFKFFGSFADG